MTLARICTLPGLDWGRGRLREREVLVSPTLPGTQSRTGSDSQESLSGAEHTTQHEVEPGRLTRSGACHPGLSEGARLSPARGLAGRLLFRSWSKKKRLKGRGRRYLEILHFLRPPSSTAAAATPDFLFFFTGIFRPPRRGGQASRGRGSLPAEDSSGLAPASHRQQQAKEQSCQPAPERRSPAAARSQVPCPSFSAQSRGGSPPAGTSADHTGKRTLTAPHRRQSHTTTGRSAAWPGCGSPEPGSNASQRGPPGAWLPEGRGSSLRGSTLPGLVSLWGRLQWRSWALLTRWPPLVVTAIPTFLTKLPIYLNTDGNPPKNVLGNH